MTKKELLRIYREDRNNTIVECYEQYCRDHNKEIIYVPIDDEEDTDKYIYVINNKAYLGETGLIEAILKDKKFLKEVGD